MQKAGYLGSLLGAGLTALGLALFAMVSTNPAGIGPYGVTLWFLILLTSLSCFLALGFYMLANRFNRKPNAVPLFPSVRRGVLAAGWLTIMLGLSSLQQLSWRDILLTGMLIVLAEFYLGTKS